MYRCDICGKFRKLEHLDFKFTPDNAFSGEDSYTICIKCIEKTIDMSSVMFSIDEEAYKKWKEEKHK